MNTDVIVDLTDSDQPFSQIAELAEKAGHVVVYNNNEENGNNGLSKRSVQCFHG